jgi:hypothetical protein
MDKELTEEGLQEIKNRAKRAKEIYEMDGIYYRDAETELKLLSHIEQLEESSKKWDSIEQLYIDAEKRYEYKIEQQAQEIERLKGQLFELSESSYKNVMILMEQRNKANDECEQLGIKAQRLEEALKAITYTGIKMFKLEDAQELARQALKEVRRNVE